MSMLKDDENPQNIPNPEKFDEKLKMCNEIIDKIPENDWDVIRRLEKPELNLKKIVEKVMAIMISKCLNDYNPNTEDPKILLDLAFVVTQGPNFSWDLTKDESILLQTNENNNSPNVKIDL